MSRHNDEELLAMLQADDKKFVDPITGKNLTEFICNNFHGTQRIEYLMKDARLHHNLYSMWELAQIYRNQDSLDDYIFWLRRIYSESWQYAEALRMEKHDPYTINNLLGDALIWSEVIIPAYDELGLLEMAKGDEKSIQEAILIFRSIDCHYYDAPQRIEQARMTLERLKKSACNTDDFTIDLEKEIGPEAWRLLQATSRSYIYTSQYVFNDLFHLDENEQQKIDFSCAILPLMKALELELKKLFSLEYLKYLRQFVYSSETYCSLNGIDPGKLENEWPFYKKDEAYNFRISDLSEDAGSVSPYIIARFTLGNLTHIVGRKKTKNGTFFYKTALDFCYWKGITDPQKWLEYITTSVDQLIRKRNESAHAGEIATIMDANYCLDRMIYINRLIRNIVLFECDNEVQFSDSPCTGKPSDV